MYKLNKMTSVNMEYGHMLQCLTVQNPRRFVENLKCTFCGKVNIAAVH